MFTFTVGESPGELPAAPLSVGRAVVVAPAAGAVRVTAGWKLEAVAKDAPEFVADAVNVACEACTAAAAARRAASRTTSRVMPTEDALPVWSRATGRPACSGR